MGNLKKLLLVAVLVVAGLLLSLAGLNLIELSKNLILYSGVGLLILALLTYFFM